MSTETLIEDTAQRIFGDHVDKSLLDAAETGEFPGSLWSVLCENGLTRMGTRASETTLEHAFSVVRIAASHAAPLPLAEVIIAGVLAEDAGCDVEGLTVLGIGDEPVAWARAADHVLLVEEAPGGCSLAVHRFDSLEVVRGHNMAGEARDRVVADGEPEWSGTSQMATVDELRGALAVARATQMAGSMNRVLEMCVGYALERKQFGRAIAQFQAVQHQLAVLAAETSAATRAADAAVAALAGDDLMVEAAIAKARTGEAAGIVAEIAHQVHGAMGFTYEHTLHHFTRRLWAWRDEYGQESHWQAQLGARILAQSPTDPWLFIAER